jgi:superfamily II RNA helicase
MNAPIEPPLLRHLPRESNLTADAILDGFMNFVAEKGLELYPAQEAAILEILAGKHVILNTPTGSGKSLVATALHFKALAEDKVSIYTCPIKALVSEKFFALCELFGPDNVGMMTGDAAVNRDAPIMCCTAEILANVALAEAEFSGADYVIMDEFHYYSDRDRGVAWQVPLLVMKNTTFLLMSATLGETEFFEKDLESLTGKPAVTVRSKDRPVPLYFHYQEIPLHETVSDLVERCRAPIYIVCFTQRSCAEEAQNLMSTDFCTKEEKKAIAEELRRASFSSPYGKDMQKFLRHGIGIHHAGLLPRYRLLVEKLAQKGMLKIICGTDTLGVGVNIPIRTVLFTKLCKFDGEKTTILSVRDFMQISGRAGRKGFDDEGTVVVQAPEHVIENLRLERKVAGDAKKMRKLVRKKPPDKGYVPWDKETFEKLINSLPEPLVSRFQVSHGMLLQVLSRENDGCKAMKKLLNSTHDPVAVRKQHKRSALAMFRSLVRADIITLQKGGVQVNADLQKDFSIHHALALYLINAISLLDREDPNYSFDLLSFVESILENPTIILMKQLDKLRTEKMAELKAEGVEYEKRLEELDRLEYPKPNSEFIYQNFNEFSISHPWVKQENIRPKSIARDMYETFQSFSEYIKSYGLQRFEGVLLRYLSEVYKTLVQTVPEYAKIDETDEMITYLGSMLRAVDASLLDEWERMRNPDYILNQAKNATEPEPEVLLHDITRDRRSFFILIRNAVFTFVRALSQHDYATLVDLIEPNDPPWEASSLEQASQAFWEDHSVLLTSPQARAPKLTRISERTESLWVIEQVLCDGEEDNDWVLEFQLEPEQCRAKQAVLLQFIGIHR